MSQNLKLLGEYSNAMFSGDTEAVFGFWSTDFVRTSPENGKQDRSEDLTHRLPP